MPSSRTVGQTQLDDLVAAVHGVYSGKDARRSLWDVWMHASHHASAIGEEVRKGVTGCEQLLIEIADFAMWLFTAVHKLQGDIGVQKPGETEQESLIHIAYGLSDMLWNKFPGLCPVCYWRRTGGERSQEQSSGFARPCDCLLSDVERRDQSQKRRHTTALRAFSLENIASKPKGVDEWQRMFAEIFAANLRHLELTNIAFHLLEEMGEVSDAMARMYTYKEGGFVPGEPRCICLPSCGARGSML